MIDTPETPIPEDAATWAVLKCYTQQAPALVAQLTDLGGATYYPTVTRVRRIPRHNKRERVARPAFPGYIFVAWAGAQDCRALWRDPRMPPAQVLAVRGEPLTLDRGRIVALAEAERQWARPDRSPADFIPAPGTWVRFRVGPFEGMRAEVVKATAWDATVDLGIGPVTTPTDALEAA